MGASNSADTVTAITKGLSNMLFNIRPTVLPGCPANITFTWVMATYKIADCTRYIPYPIYT
jgi:hypothetical protein